MQVEHIRLDPGLKALLVVNQLKVHPFSKVMVFRCVVNLHPYTVDAKSAVRAALSACFPLLNCEVGRGASLTLA